MSIDVGILAANSSAQIAAHRVGSSWMWYTIRGAGFAAAGLLILLMLSGIGQVTGLTYRFFEPVKAWIIHKALAIGLCVAIFIHVFFLLFDNFLPFSLVQVLVPFASQYSNGAKLIGVSLAAIGVALGILAAYSVIIIVLSSLGWIDSKKKTWRWLHYLSYFVFFAVFMHALVVGSDLKYGGFRSIWIMLLLVVSLAIISRLARAGSLRRPSNIKADRL